jgi:hypothetical protein
VLRVEPDSLAGMDRRKVNWPVKQVTSCATLTLMSRSTLSEMSNYVRCLLTPCHDPQLNVATVLWCSSRASPTT